jgi:outer membrane receptor protein involved in Fe transport
VLLDAPGVSRAGPSGGELAVWGATPGESKVYLDGVQIPRLFHAGGLRTTVHPALIRRVTLIPGAPDAAYGRGTGGVVEVSSHRRLISGYHGTLRVDGVDASLALSAATKRVEVLLAARQGYLDRLAQLLFADASEVLPLPSHTDAVARIAVRLDSMTSLTATWSYAREQVGIERDDAAGPQLRHARRWFHVASLALDRRYGNSAQLRIVPFVSVADDRERELFSAIPLQRAQRADAYGLRAEYVHPTPKLELRLGIDARGEHTQAERAGTLTLPAREGDIRIFGQAPVEAVASDSFTTWVVNVAPHAALLWRLHDLDIATALRLESYVISASRVRPRFGDLPAVGQDSMHVLPEPRLRITYRPSGWATVEARAALVHQPPDAQDLSAVFGNPKLSPSRAVHVMAGPTFALPVELELELIGYYKWLDDLAVRDDAPQPLLAQALLNRGRGHSYGGSLSLRRNTSIGLFGSAVYTLSRSLRSDPNGSLRAFDQDQTHVLSLLFGYGQPRWLLSLRGRAASGNPRTSVIGSYPDATSGVVQPLFAGHNRARVPVFFQLDLHAETRFYTQDALIALWLDVWNATNHVNIEEVAYTPDFSRRRDLRGLPCLAMLGLRVEL